MEIEALNQVELLLRCFQAADTSVNLFRTLIVHSLLKRASLERSDKLISALCIPMLGEVLCMSILEFIGQLASGSVLSQKVLFPTCLKLILAIL